MAGGLQQLVTEIPWGHNLLILNKISDPTERLYYQLKPTLPKELKGKLPTTQQLSKALGLPVKKKRRS